MTLATKEEGLGGLVSDFPKFVYAAELKTLVAIEAEITRIDGHRLQLNSMKIGQDLRAARALYCQDPTEKRFLAVCYEAFRYCAIVESSALTTFREEIVGIGRKIFEREFRPAAKKILERGLVASRKRLAQITATEDTRVRSLIGLSADARTSPVVVVASKPCQAIEGLLATLDSASGNLKHRMSSVIGFLSERLAEGEGSDR